MALRAAQAGVARIIGHSPTPSDGVAAARAGAVTELLQDVRGIFRRADFVVISAPPAATMHLLKRAAASQFGRGGGGGGAYLTDVSSVKRPFVERAAKLGLSANFAGSHPLVEAGQGGFRAARADLFVEKIVYVTTTPDSERASREVADFWHQVLEARPVTLDAAFHDSMVAWTRHLPQAAAAVVAATLGTHGPKGVTYGHETRSVTALAARQQDALAEVLLLNREALVDALQNVDRSLQELESALQTNDAQGVRDWLDAASKWRARLGS